MEKFMSKTNDTAATRVLTDSELDTVAVYGRMEGTAIFELLGMADEGAAQSETWAGDYESGLAAYRATPDLANITGTRWGALQAVTTYVDHVQPTRATAGRSHQEARFERATEPAALKDRAVALLTEGGTQS